MGHSDKCRTIWECLSRLVPERKGVAGMDENKSFDMGVAGSLTMIFLSLAMVFLMVSFYRRYKRLVDRKDQE
jgi:hypothetical protein